MPAPLKTKLHEGTNNIQQAMASFHFRPKPAEASPLKFSFDAGSRQGCSESHCSVDSRLRFCNEYLLFSFLFNGFHALDYFCLRWWLPILPLYNSVPCSKGIGIHLAFDPVFTFPVNKLRPFSLSLSHNVLLHLNNLTSVDKSLSTN